MKNLSYDDCGVSIDNGNDLVSRLKPLVKNTFSPLVMDNLGGFSARFKMPNNFKNPVLCSSTDGVGSKVKLAIKYDKLDSIGIDLVAMCVNDLICDFAAPLFFLDYYATNKIDVEKSVRIINGIVEGCKIAQCALIGGESAEMPSVYAKNDFDLAGFSVGIAENDDFKKRENIQHDDIILALPSSGFHSNGYSLIQGIVEKYNINLNDVFNGKKLIDLALEPTRIYVSTFLENKDSIKALAHITGGGIIENLVRVLPQNTKAVINKNAIKTPEFFEIFTKYVDENEKFRVFNMGVGMILIADKNSAEKIMQNSNAYKIGKIESCDKKEVILKD